MSNFPRATNRERQSVCDRSETKYPTWQQHQQSGTHQGNQAMNPLTKKEINEFSKSANMLLYF